MANHCWRSRLISSALTMADSRSGFIVPSTGTNRAYREIAHAGFSRNAGKRCPDPRLAPFLAGEQRAAAERRPDHRRIAEALRMIEAAIGQRIGFQHRHFDLVGGQGKRQPRGQQVELRGREIGDADRPHLA